jgi:hypothetical protein
VVFGLRGSPADDLLREVRAEQLNTLFRQMPIAVAVNVVNAAITAIVLERLADLPWPAVWFCAVLLVSAARSVLWLRHRRVDGPRESRWQLGSDGSRRGTGCGLVLGRGRRAPVRGLAGARSNVPDRRNRRDVRRRGGNEGLSSLDRSRVPVVGEPAVGDAVFFQGTTTGNALGIMILVFAAALSLGARHFSLFSPKPSGCGWN